MSFATLIATGVCLMAVCSANPTKRCEVTHEINTVCDTNGTPYDNPSVAICAGVHNANAENCPRIDNSLPGDQNGVPVQPLPVEEGCYCPYVYRPVCVWNEDGSLTTYGNDCHAECSGESQASADNCPRIDNSLPSDENGVPVQPLPVEAQCVCGMVYNPVCSWNADGSLRAYSNKCQADCVEDENAKAENCPRVDNSLPDNQNAQPVRQRCNCGRNYRPVCARNEDGHLTTYDNKCLADCVNADIEYSDQCTDSNNDDDDDDDDDSSRRHVKRNHHNPCVCTADFRPVCGSDGVTYSNKCTAECANVDSYTDHACSEQETPQHLPAFSNLFRDLMKKKRA